MKNYFAYLFIGLFLTGCFGKSTTTSTEKTIVNSCDENNNNKTACLNSKLKDGTECEYDDNKKICYSSQTSKVYVWEKVALPNLVKESEVLDFVMTKAGDIYLVNSASNPAGTDNYDGLIYSSDKGKTWKSLEQSLKASPMDEAEQANLTSLGSRSNDEQQIKTAHNHLIFMSYQGGIIFNRDKAVFGIDKTKHHDGVSDNNNQIAELKNKEIVFIDLIEAGPSNEKIIIFGAKHPKGLFVRSLGNSATKPALLNLKNSDGSADLDNQHWLAVGSAQNGNILFGGAKAAPAGTEDSGIWEFAKAQITPDGGDVNVINNNPLITPSDDGAWDSKQGSVSGPNKLNISIGVVGSFDNTHYFAGMNDFESTSGGRHWGDDAVFGIAHAKKGETAQISFSGKKVLRLAQFDGKNYIKFDSGFSGINNDGTSNSDHEDFLKNIKTNKDHMMKDKKAVDLEESETVEAVYGTSQDMFIWLGDKGIYRRVETDGSPRE